MSKLILIVEDEQDLVSALEYNLKREGYQVASALTGAAALDRLGRSPAPDLVVLDLMLPDIGGTEICRSLRAAPATRDVPVLMLSAKDQEIDRVVGFEVGADDYVVKPFSVRELLLRVRAILRRARSGGETAGEAIVFGVLRVDPGGHRVWVDAREVTLTALEFKLLLMLLERKGRVQSREQLLEEVWGYNAEVTTRTVDTHVKRLRGKLGGEAADYIETLRGVGYRFRSELPESAG